MSEIGYSQREGAPQKEKDQNGYMLRFKDSSPMTVELPQETSARGIEKRSSLHLSEKLPPKSVIEIPINLENSKYFEVSEPLSQSDKERHSNSIWLDEAGIDRYQFNFLKKAGRPTFKLEDLPLTSDSKKELKPILQTVEAPVKQAA